MKTIRFHFCNQGSPADGLIVYMQYGWPYSHVDLCVPTSDQYYGSKWPNGVHYRDRYAVVKETFVELPCEDDKYDIFWAFLLSQENKPYDMQDLLGNFVIERDWRSDNKWWCSELVAAALEKARICALFPVGVNHVTPRDVGIAITMVGGKFL